MLLAGARGFFPFTSEGFSTLNRVSPLWLDSFTSYSYTSFITTLSYVLIVEIDACILGSRDDTHNAYMNWFRFYFLY